MRRSYRRQGPRKVSADTCVSLNGWATGRVVNGAVVEWSMFLLLADGARLDITKHVDDTSAVEFEVLEGAEGRSTWEGEVEDVSVLATASGIAIPYDSGRHGHIDNWYPPEGGGCEDIEVTLPDGTDITRYVSDSALESIDATLYEQWDVYEPEEPDEDDRRDDW